jgi:hypothetical protein
MAEEKQEGQKTIVSFVVGLLIGGLLVWAFSGPASDESAKEEVKEDAVGKEVKNESKEVTTTTEQTEVTQPVEKATLPVGEGKISIGDQSASSAIKLDAATYPIAEGWVGVRDYSNGQLGGLLGVVRFSEAQGLVPNQIVLQRSTTAGNEYAVVVFKENGDREFNLAEDAQVGEVYATFTAK